MARSMAIKGVASLTGWGKNERSHSDRASARPEANLERRHTRGCQPPRDSEREAGRFGGFQDRAAKKSGAKAQIPRMEVGIDIPTSWGWACAPLIFGHPRSAREPQETWHSLGAGFRVKPEGGVTSPDAAVATFEPGSGRDRGQVRPKSRNPVCKDWL